MEFRLTREGLAVQKRQGRRLPAELRERLDAAAKRSALEGEALDLKIQRGWVGRRVDEVYKG